MLTASQECHQACHLSSQHGMGCFFLSFILSLESVFLLVYTSLSLLLLFSFLYHTFLLLFLEPTPTRGQISLRCAPVAGCDFWMTDLINVWLKQMVPCSHDANLTTKLPNIVTLKCDLHLMAFVLVPAYVLFVGMHHLFVSKRSFVKGLCKNQKLLVNSDTCGR